MCERKIMKNTKLFLTLALVGAMSPIAARAAMMQVDPAPQVVVNGGQDDPLYTAGTKAMDEQRWADAVAAFDKVAASKGKHADAALYWKAYSLDKLGRKDEARTVCESLRQQLPSSAWNKECVVLRVSGSAADAREIAEKMRDEARENAREAARAQVMVVGPNGERTYSKTYSNSSHTTSEDDIKILALNVLLQQEPTKALPLLHNMIMSDAPIEVRKQAMFVLSRSKDPQAQAMLVDIATNSKDPSLQEIAVQSLAIYHPKDSAATLVQIYKTTNDAHVKRSVINGLFIARDAARLVDLARGEKDLNLKRDIVSQLALMHDPVATAYMEELLK
jgi:tetratricopeptide (TPR) repeat protein